MMITKRFWMGSLSYRKGDKFMQPKVSVVMPMLNSEEYLRECLDSVINQTLKNIEIICVDAGSTDGTLEILEEYASKDNRISIIHSEMKSYGHQMNLGLKAAKGEYLAILESDDYIKNDMYEVLTEIADANELEVIKADYNIFVGDKENRRYTYKKILELIDCYNMVVNPQEDSEIFKASLVTWAGLYRIDFLKNNNILHHESLGASYQDNGFWFQVFCHAQRVMFYNKPFYMLRRDNPNSSVKSKGKVYCMCEEYDFIRNSIKKDSAMEKKFAPLVAVYRFGSYRLNLDRISNEFKLDFVKRIAVDFNKIKNEGELREELFSTYNWKLVNEIMNDPAAYYYRNFDKLSQNNNSRIQQLQRDLNAIRNSRSYKIGRAITFVPRKIRGGIRCYEEHGLRYTLKRVLHHLGLEKRAEEPKRLKKTKKDYDYYLGLKSEQYEEELKLWFKERTGKELDLENPKTFNEKIQWMKLYDSTPLKTRLADKYLVREWVKEKIGEEYLIPLLGVYDSFDEIDFEELPNQFALKTNHGSGWNIIIHDVSNLDKKEAKKKFDGWLKRNYAFNYGMELHYMNILPKIICEKYMADLADGDIYDYRFFCFNGVPEFVWVDIGSGTNHHKRNIYDVNWVLQNYRVNYPNLEPAPEKPSNFDEMLECVKKLCVDFAFVRVDFYSSNGKVYFGEMTFTPQSGTGKWEDEEQNELYGELIKLPEKSSLPERKR